MLQAAPLPTPAPEGVLRRMPWIMGISLASLGATAPYLAVELRAQGVDGWALTLAMVSIPVSRLVVGPLWGVLADRRQDDAWVLRLASAVGLVGTVALAAELGPWAPLWVLVWVAGRGGLGPVLDAMTLKALGADTGRYGQVRAWGSVGFAVAVLGAALARDAWGLSTLWSGALLAAVGLALVWPLPPAPPSPRVAVGAALRALGADPAVRWILIGAALHYAPHSVYDTYFAVLGEDLGLPAAWVGAAVAAGVVVEVGVMVFSRGLIRRFGPMRLLVFAAALAVPRWVLTALAPPGLALVTQGVHGLTFGLFWVATVHLLAARAPREVASSAQGLLGAAVGGVGAIAGTLGGGVVLDVLGSRALFWAAAGLSVLALGAWARLSHVLRAR